MTKRNYIFTLIAVFGLLLIPETTYACDNEIQKSCCNSDVETSETEKDCCGNQKSENENQECGGKCGKSSCTTISIISSGLITNFEVEFTNNIFDFSCKKQKFYNPKSFISKGFKSIWLPPVIC